MKKKDVRPPYETLVKLASALNTSLSVLLDEIAVYPSEAVIDMPIIGSVRIEGADLEECHVLGEVVDILRKPRKKVW